MIIIRELMQGGQITYTSSVLASWEYPTGWVCREGVCVCVGGTHWLVCGLLEGIWESHSVCTHFLSLSPSHTTLYSTLSLLP